MIQDGTVENATNALALPNASDLGIPGGEAGILLDEFFQLCANWCIAIGGVWGSVAGWCLLFALVSRIVVDVLVGESVAAAATLNRLPL